MSASGEETARALMETNPRVMQAIRRELRSLRSEDLSVPQFRVLNYLNRHPDTSLSPVAEYVGLTLPSMSRLVDGLVERGLVLRQTCGEDRRKIVLNLSGHGGELLECNYSRAMSSLAKKINQLAPDEKDIVLSAMRILANLFTDTIPLNAVDETE
jgi:DNA-binding MarR family transcriptional regulator